MRFQVHERFKRCYLYATVPVGIKGNYELLSPKCLFRPTKIRIYIGRPIYSLGNVSIEKGADRVMEEIGKLLNQPVIKDIKKSS